MMYSYFLWYRDEDFDLQRLNICCSVKPEDLHHWENLLYFWKCVAIRRKELHLPFDLLKVGRYRIISDPAHSDPLVWSNADNARGTFKLAGEYPGRANRPLL